MKEIVKKNPADYNDQSAQSLYNTIVSAVVDGELPADFSLPQNAGEGELRWSDGAMDGVAIYHMGFHEISEEEKKLMEEAVQAASDAHTEEADVLFGRLGQQVRAISVIDNLQSLILEKRDVLSAAHLYRYAFHAVTDSADRECVKFGLCLLELFQTDEDEDVKAAVRTLGLSDEFSIFSVFVMRQWKNGNDEIFKLAKKIHGWGRIHAIEQLAPEGEEIKQWLLREGVHNRVLPSYSALTCWQNSDAAEVLQGDLSREDFSGIRDILEGLLDEGPCSGISEIENAADMILAFLHKAMEMRLAEDRACPAAFWRKTKNIRLILEDYKVIRIIGIYYKEDNSEIAALCRELLDSEDCRGLVREAVKGGEALDLAKDLHIEYKADILQLLKAEFDNHYFLSNYLTEDAGYRSEVLGIFKQNLMLDEMKTTPTKSLGLGEAYKKCQQLEFLVQILSNYPLEGIEFVETALQCAHVRTRNQGLSALQDWVGSKNTSLEEMLPDTYALLKRLQEIEVDDGVRERMEQMMQKC